MDAKRSKELIAAAGGDSAFALMIGLDPAKSCQRVNNWKRRGIPAQVVLDNLQVIRRLSRTADPDNGAASGAANEGYQSGGTNGQQIARCG